MGSLDTELSCATGRWADVQPANLYQFTEGLAGTTNIGDGGNDMYDGGNLIQVSTAAGSSTAGLTYTQSCSGVLSSAGVGDVQYTTCKVGNLFVAGFFSDSASITGVSISGNNGCDGSCAVYYKYCRGLTNNNRH